MSDPIQVVITLPFSKELVQQVQQVSPRLQVQVIPARDASDIPADILARTDILYTSRALPEPEQAPRLKWIQFHWAGVDHAVHVPILQKEGVLATTLSGASATQMGEFILMMLLALGHHLPALIDNQRRQEWPRDRWERFAPQELRDSTVGIVGYGSIGRQAARLLTTFGAIVLATKRDVMQPEDRGYAPEGIGDPRGEMARRLYPPQALRSMLSECDFVVVTAPLTAETQGMINADAFEAFKPTAYLVDVARGGIVDQQALIAALREGKLAGAALDVFPEEPLPEDSPLWNFENVIITPHLSGITPHYDERAVQLFIENLERFLEGEPLLNQVEPERGY